jgi:opacity protein-like surface antigen
MTAALLAGLSLIATPTNARVTPGTQQAAITLGLADPVGNDSADNNAATLGSIGPAFGFSYLYQLRGRLSLGGDFNDKRLRTKAVSTGAGLVDIKSSAWTLLAVAKGDLTPDADIRPYGLVGLGVGGVNREDLSQNPGFNFSRSSAGAAFALGVGADYDIAPAWLAGAELRYDIISTSRSEVGASSFSALNFLVKVGCKF